MKLNISKDMKQKLHLLIVLVILPALLAVTVLGLSKCSFDDGQVSSGFTNTDFTQEEKSAITSLINDSLPMIPNNEYHFELKDAVIHFYTVGNNEVDFESYKTTVVSHGYKFETWDKDLGFIYGKNNISLSMKNFNENDKFIIDVTVKLKDGSGNQGGNDNQGTHQELSYTIGQNLPTGLTYITNSAEYPDPQFASDGGLKLRFEGQGVESDVFSASNSVKVTINFSQLNENQKTGTNSKYFTITGIDSNGNVVDTEYLTTVKLGENVVTLDGTGIVKVEVIMTGYPYNGTKYLNPVIDKIVLELNSNSSSQGGNESGNTGGNTGNQGGTETKSDLAKLLEEASTLAPGERLSGERTITGTVKEITEVYTTKFKNISFYLTDGQLSILVHRGKGDCAATLKVGDTVTVTGIVENYILEDGSTVLEFNNAPTLTGA